MTFFMEDVLDLVLVELFEIASRETVLVFWTNIVRLENRTSVLTVDSLKSTCLVLFTLLSVEPFGIDSKAMVAAEEMLLLDSINEQGMRCCDSWLE